MNLLNWILDGTIAVGDGQLFVREVVGNLFGLGSAILGMRRIVWAWPLGLIGNVLLFTVFVTGEMSGATAEPLWGQAGRQVFFVAVSLYGWWRWSRSRAAGGAADGGAITPRWATWAERGQLLALGVVGYAAAYALLTRIGSWGPATEAWILAGSMLATYGMARGWVEFWLVWTLVDVVGVTTLVQAGYYPTAGMYLVYAAFVVVGFVVWSRASAPWEQTSELEGVAPVSESIRLDSVERAIADIAAGKAVVVVDDEDRENEGDIIFAAAKGHPGTDGLHHPPLQRSDLRADAGPDARRWSGPAAGHDVAHGVAPDQAAARDHGRRPGTVRERHPYWASMSTSGTTCRPSRSRTAAGGPKELTGMADLTRDQRGRVRARLLDLVPGLLQRLHAGRGVRYLARGAACPGSRHGRRPVLRRGGRRPRRCRSARRAAGNRRGLPLPR